ncbi:unnamed protein product [Cyprideis torosa]|uniref:Uncharacterized protein n=1 Tax=Cyprideis torosa TaxID=163714 RepID=A0A7R8WRN7_9CRUS|nr:unnamed protein product [Cyprideis torosa]CAG0903903.1 unnamed protein product [Cyprideis torosa]
MCGMEWLAALCSPLCLFFVISVSPGSAVRWQQDVPAQRIEVGSDYHTLSETSSVGGAEIFEFIGNESQADYFKLLLPVRDTLLIGGRNAIFNVSLQDLTLRSTLDWSVSETDAFNCYRKGRSQDLDCHNYIRVLLLLPNGNIFSCGTNAFAPVCREFYITATGKYTQIREDQGVLYSPFDPSFNSTILLHNGELYSGSFGGFHGSDPLIFGRSLRTRQYDPNHLNDPDFVHSVARGDAVFFFFRETAVEYTNCGKRIYSRVARVCSTDQGGVLGQAKHRWSTYLKSRLNCSIPGEYPFYFDEIQGVTDLVSGSYAGEKREMIYATFTTGPNAIPGSAVCAFSLQDIYNVFEGPFKHQESPGSSFWSVPGPDPRPGRCIKQAAPVDSTWIESHPLMDEAVRSFFGQPIVIRSSFDHGLPKYRFTQIAVDPQVRTPDNRTYDVIFIGTDQGVVLKAYNALAPDSRSPVQSVIVEERQAFPEFQLSRAVRSLKVIRDEFGRWTRLVVVSDEKVRSFLVAQCDQANTCGSCVFLRDPYCAWDRQVQKCIELNRLSHSQASPLERYVQELQTGRSKICPEDGPSSSITGSHTLQKDSTRILPGEGGISVEGEGNTRVNIFVTEEGASLYTVETLAVTVAAASVGALLLGFLLGYGVGRRCKKEQYDAGPCVDAEYEFLEQRPSVPVQMTRMSDRTMDRGGVGSGTSLLAAHHHQTHGCQQEEQTYFTPGHYPVPVHYATGLIGSGVSPGAAGAGGTLPHHFSKPSPHLNMILDLNGSTPHTTATIDRRAFYTHAQGHSSMRRKDFSDDI